MHVPLKQPKRSAYLQLYDREFQIDMRILLWFVESCLIYWRTFSNNESAQLEPLDLHLDEFSTIVARAGYIGSLHTE